MQKRYQFRFPPRNLHSNSWWLRLQVNLCQKLFYLQNMRRTCCVQKLFWMSETISVHNMFSPGLSLEFSCIELVHKSMNNLSSYCGLVDAKIRASDKDLPVPRVHCYFFTNKKKPPVIDSLWLLLLNTIRIFSYIILLD